MHNLDFLNEIIKRDETNLHKNFLFMKSELEDNVWIFKFKSKEFKIDFNVKLSDGSLLTNSKHIKTLNTLKQLIIYSIHDNKGYLQAEKTILAKVNTVLKIFDYINFNDDDKSFSKFGFSIIDSNYLINMLNIFASSNYDLDAFNFNNILLKFYNKEINQSKEKPINIELLNEVELSSIYNYFTQNKINLSILYPNFIRNVSFSSFPNYFENVKSRNDVYIKEFPGYFRQQDYNILSEGTFSKYINALRAFVTFTKDFKANNDYSLISILELEKANSYISNINLVSRKRFETYPTEEIINLLGKAINFHIKYGDKIINNYISYINNEDIDNETFKYFYSRKNLKESRVSYFNRLRANESLYHSLKTYYGCVQFVVGAIMARRRSELATLKAFECIDSENNYLYFHRAKSSKNTFGLRDKIKLPIDELCIDMIQNLQKIHKACNSVGYLFSMPIKNEPSKISDGLLSKSSYDEKLDMLFDYLEAPVIDNKRLYVRQHQLRRFFAMAFFWKGGFGSLDTLRWFLAHTDVSHVYNYITETVPGEILKEVKAQYVIENIEQYGNLRSLIIKRFKTDNFDLLDSDTLTEYVESLIDNKEITIEPEFLTDDNNKQYNIVVSIKE